MGMQAQYYTDRHVSHRKANKRYYEQNKDRIIKKNNARKKRRDGTDS